MFAPQQISRLVLFVLLIVSSVISQENSLFNENSAEIRARVARLSFIRGGVQIRRANEKHWEEASLNLPLVEGDEITTSENSRLEIQFDSQNFLRLDENSQLKIVTLREDGTAVSLKEGLLSLRIFNFEKDNRYFEIDAPNTTIAVQQPGLFRLEARNGNYLRLTAADGGQARVYSEDAGFTLRNGRIATVFLQDDRLGEWETAEDPQKYDEWDEWISERDNKLNSLLKNSHYGSYYDRDIYGAEELNDYGNWSDSADYGKVWRPAYSAVVSYSNWSPYRYGHWRWVKPYGWVWINDEPWGWSTSHYGRWIYDSGGWGWTPYSYNRPKRSWWRPALVVLFNVNNDVCWYPLPYRDRYRDFNLYHRNHNEWSNRSFNTANYGSLPYRNLPDNSVVGIRSDYFGRRHTPHSISPRTLRQVTESNQNLSLRLPDFQDRGREFRRDNSFRPSYRLGQIRTGAIDRPAGVKLDSHLQNGVFRESRRKEKVVENLGENKILRRDGRFERRNQQAETAEQNQMNRRIILPPPVNSENDRRNRELQQKSPVSEENIQRRRNLEGRSEENRSPLGVSPDNSLPDNRRSRIRDENPEHNQLREKLRERNSENNRLTTNVQREFPRPGQNNRPDPLPPGQNQTGSERQQKRREKPIEERRREVNPEERREAPRQEQPRQSPQRRESPRSAPRTEKRGQPNDN